MNRIAVDIDETLLHFLPNMAKFHKMELPHKKFRYVYRNIFDITEARSKRMVIDFYNSQEFHDLEPMKGSQEKLLELRNKCSKLYVVTGRQYYVRQRTEDWIEKHYSGIFDDIVLICIDNILYILIFNLMPNSSKFPVCIRSLKNMIE